VHTDSLREFYLSSIFRHSNNVNWVARIRGP
jgi:hypothetical protein